MRQKDSDYVADLLWYEKVEVNGQRYLLVHGGLGNFDIKRILMIIHLMSLYGQGVDYDVRYLMM